MIEWLMQPSGMPNGVVALLYLFIVTLWFVAAFRD